MHTDVVLVLLVLQVLEEDVIGSTGLGQALRTGLAKPTPVSALNLISDGTVRSKAASLVARSLYVQAYDEKTGEAGIRMGKRPKQSRMNVRCMDMHGQIGIAFDQPQTGRPCTLHIPLR